MIGHPLYERGIFFKVFFNGYGEAEKFGYFNFKYTSANDQHIHFSDCVFSPDSHLSQRAVHRGLGEVVGVHAALFCSPSGGAYDYTLKGTYFIEFGSIDFDVSGGKKLHLRWSTYFWKASGI